MLPGPRQPRDATCQGEPPQTQSGQQTNMQSTDHHNMHHAKMTQVAPQRGRHRPGVPHQKRPQYGPGITVVMLPMHEQSITK